MKFSIVKESCLIYSVFVIDLVTGNMNLTDSINGML